MEFRLTFVFVMMTFILGHMCLAYHEHDHI